MFRLETLAWPWDNHAQVFVLMDANPFQSALRDRRLVADAQSSSDSPEGHPLRQDGLREIGRRQSFARTQQTGSGSTGSGGSDEFAGKEFFDFRVGHPEQVRKGSRLTGDSFTMCKQKRR